MKEWRRSKMTYEELKALSPFRCAEVEVSLHEKTARLVLGNERGPQGRIVCAREKFDASFGIDSTAQEVAMRIIYAANKRGLLTPGAELVITDMDAHERAVN